MLEALSEQQKAMMVGYRDGLLQGQKHDPFSTSPTGPYSHGQFGLFNMPGSLRSLYSAIIKPRSLANDLPMMEGIFNPNTMWNADVGITTLVTGVTSGTADSVANQPTAKCAEPPVGGLLKLCSMVNPYGKYWGGTDPVDLTEIGAVTHRDEPIGFTVQNDFTSPNVLTPTNPGPSMSGLEMELSRRTTLSLFSFHRMMGERVYIGSPVNSTASNNWKDIVGLETHVNTGNKRDAYTSNICTAANSVVFDAGYVSIDEDPVQIYRLIEEAHRHVRFNARQSGLNPVMWKIALREELFTKVARSVPVTEHLHALNTMSNFTNGRVVINANDATELTNRMMTELYLPLNGVVVPVVLDDFIPEANISNNGNLLPGEFSSDIYFIPYPVLGGQPVTGWDFRRYDNADVRTAMSMLGNTTAEFQLRDGGRVLWMKFVRSSCVQLAYVVAPRLIMMTPQIAARVQNIAYTPIQHLRSYDPDSQYFADGGRTNGESSSFYNSWSSSPSVIGVR